MSIRTADAESALSHIIDGSIVAISGFNLVTAPEYLILQLYELYRKTGHPKKIFVITDTLPATPGRALDRVAEQLYGDPNQEFLRGGLIPFLGFSPWLQKMIRGERIECYGWPIGITAYWFREIASGRPGLITKIGIDTFLDPRREGAALNETSRKNMSCKIRVIDIDGEDYLLYQAPKPNYALIRASIADENGNLSMEDEGTRGSVLSIAQAVKARPKQGLVIAQVRWLTKSFTLNPRNVDIPGPLVDFITFAPKEYHWQGDSIEYDPRLSYKIVPPITSELIESMIKRPSNQYEKVIARKILLELIKIIAEKSRPVLVNLGIGIPAFVSSVIAEENISEFIVTVLETGIWGGVALSGADFGLAISPFAISTIPDMFSNFEGGIIDAASLGFLQIDKEGNVNPSILPDKIFGPGGFPVIASGAPRTYFAGAFSAGQSKISVSDNKLHIIQDGPIPKFVDSVLKIVFSGHQATKYMQQVLYITERAVFRLAANGLILEEVAPGVDIDKHILSKMSFRPMISSNLKEMEKVLFNEGRMNVKDQVISVMKR